MAQSASNPDSSFFLNQVDERDPEDKEKLRAISDDLLKEVFIINSGDKLRNIFHEMGGRGLPLTTSRAALEALLTDYLDGGFFLKRLAFGFDAERSRSQWVNSSNRPTFASAKNTALQ